MRKIAILIGLEYYRKLARYKAAAAGTRTIESQLSRKYGFRADEILVVNYERLYQRKKWDGNQLKAYLSTLQLEGEYDLILVYFVGYGFVNPDTQEKYLADNFTDSSNLFQTGVSLEWFKQWVDSLFATDKLTIIDANWAITRQNNTFESNYTCELKVPEFPKRGENSVYLFSNAEGEQSWSFPWSKQTVFTDYLALALNQKVRSTDELCDFVCWQTTSAVRRELGKCQTPFSYRIGPSRIVLTDRARQKRLRQRLYYVRSYRESFQTGLIVLTSVSIVLLLAFAFAFPERAKQYAQQLDDHFDQFVGDQLIPNGQDLEPLVPNYEGTKGALVPVPVETASETLENPILANTKEQQSPADGSDSLPGDLPGLNPEDPQNDSTDRSKEQELTSAEPTDESAQPVTAADSVKTSESATTNEASVVAEEPNEADNAAEPSQAPVKTDIRPLTAGNNPVQPDSNPETPQPTEFAQAAPPATLGPVITEPFTDYTPKKATAAAASTTQKGKTGDTIRTEEAPASDKIRNDSQDFIWRESPQDRAPTMPRNFPKINDYGLR